MDSNAALHENLGGHEKLEVGSDRSFGFVFTAFFAVVGLFPLLRGGEPRLWALIASGAFLLVALVLPRVLHPLNIVWMMFGALLGRIVAPIVLGLLFFLTVTPMALVMRAMGKDHLRLKWSKDEESYWIERTPPGPAPESMKNQF